MGTKAKKSGRVTVEVKGYATAKAGLLSHFGDVANKWTATALQTAQTLANENRKLADADLATLNQFKASISKKLATDAELVAAASKAGRADWRSQAMLIAQATIAMLKAPDVKYTALRSNTARTRNAALKAGAASSAGIAFLRADGKIDPRAKNAKPKAPKLRKVEPAAPAKVGKVAPVVTVRRLAPAIVALACKVGDGVTMAQDAKADLAKCKAQLLAISKAFNTVSAEWDKFRAKYEPQA